MKNIDMNWKIAQSNWKIIIKTKGWCLVLYYVD